MSEMQAPFAGRREFLKAAGGDRLGAADAGAECLRG